MGRNRNTLHDVLAQGTSNRDIMVIRLGKHGVEILRRQIATPATWHPAISSTHYHLTLFSHLHIESATAHSESGAFTTNISLKPGDKTPLK